MPDVPDTNPDVDAALAAPLNADDPDAPVLVLDSPTIEEAEVARATLEAAGIRAILGSPTVNPIAGAIDSAIDPGWTHGVFVSPTDVEAARALLNEASPALQDLIDEQEADPTTLAEAEARANAL